MTSAPHDTTAPQTLPRLLAALLRLAELQREPVDRLALQEAVQHVQANNQHHTPQAQIASLTHHLGLKSARWLKAADASQVPALVHDPIDGWGVLVGQNAQSQWVVMRWDGARRFGHVMPTRDEDLAWLAAGAFARGEAVAPDQLEPAYLRDKVALTLVEQGKA